MPKQTLLLPRTSTIEVKILIQDGRTVTKSWFAQVPEQDVFLSDACTLDPDAVYVGRVNYCPPKCEGVWRFHDHDHSHLLWVKDGLPYRCALAGRWNLNEERGAKRDECLALIEELEQIFI